MILLTGTTGFIGSYLLDALIEKYGRDQVIVLTSKPTNKCHFILHNNYNFDKDFFFNEGFSNIKTIIHAGAFVPKSTTESEDIEKCNSNINNTYALIFAELPSLKNFIFISSVDVYGYENQITENSIEKPISLYGHSKLYCEQLISAWASQNNIKHQILRIGHVYGPGEEKYQKVIPITMQQLFRNEAIQLWGEGKDIRSFIYISDVIQAILKSINLENSSGIINIVGQEQITISELINKIIVISNIPATIDKINSSTQPRDLIFDNKKMKELLHIPNVNLDQGLSLEWDYMKNLIA